MHIIKINTRSLTITAAVIVVILVGTTIISITASTADNRAFTRKYQRHNDAGDVSQAATVSNSCTPSFLKSI
jgi:hypothetical protein